METKPRRPIFQPYIPVHRRNKQPAEDIPSPISSPRTPPKEETEVRRRGRGQFRAPSSDDFVNSTSTSTSSSTDLDKPSDTPAEEKSVIELTQKVEELSTKSSEEEKDDWEEEWEDNVEELVKKTKPETVEKKAKPAPKPTPTYDDDELTTVLDCYDFPSSFKTHHLQDMFREYESMRGGYSIKWMDDTRALIVFEHPLTAKKAYIDNVNSAFVKVRPYKGQIEKRPSGPVPRRPVTTDMVARRLVHGALGVKAVKTAEQRQAEKDLLKQAKEQRQAQRVSIQNRQKEIANAFDE